MFCFFFRLAKDLHGALINLINRYWYRRFSLFPFNRFRRLYRTIKTQYIVTRYRRHFSFFLSFFLSFLLYTDEIVNENFFFFLHYNIYICAHVHVTKCDLLVLRVIRVRRRIPFTVSTCSARTWTRRTRFKQFKRAHEIIINNISASYDIDAYYSGADIFFFFRIPFLKPTTVFLFSLSPPRTSELTWSVAAAARVLRHACVFERVKYPKKLRANRSTSRGDNNRVRKRVGEDVKSINVYTHGAQKSRTPIAAERLTQSASASRRRRERVFVLFRAAAASATLTVNRRRPRFRVMQMYRRNGRERACGREKNVFCTASVVRFSCLLRAHVSKRWGGRRDLRHRNLRRRPTRNPRFCQRHVAVTDIYYETVARPCPAPSDSVPIRCLKSAGDLSQSNPV